MKNLFLPSRSADDIKLAASCVRYGSDDALMQYCELHYGDEMFGVPNFHAQLVQTAIEHGQPANRHRALDLGCAVGRVGFEMAVWFDEVVGVDLSTRFIEVAKRLKKNGNLCYQRREEGHVVSDRRIGLRDFNLDKRADRVSFVQGNAMQLDPSLGRFDLVVAANLIDRLPDPGKFLSGVHRFVADDGVLVVASPYDWMDHFTSPDKWLGGWFRAGKPQVSQEGVEKRLQRNFSRIGDVRELEFVVRENARRYIHGISQVSCWRRKG